MEFVVAIILAGLFAWLIANFGLVSLDRSVGTFTHLIGGWRPDGWPRGVQEEDRDRPWGFRAARSDSAEPPPPTPKLTPLKPAIRRR